jgi:pimeloyl-ACP methyl ester carboxylesterase
MGTLQLRGLGEVHYHEYGTGTKPMLAFHGYGMTGKQFHVLAKSVLPDYHIYGFDHFFHGGSELQGWTEKQIIGGMPKELVREYLEQWFGVYGRQRISLMGYSIGANMVLLLLEEYAELIDEIILMAPDGITTYQGFNFLTNKTIGKVLFRSVTKTKWLIPALLKNLLRFGLIDEALYKIAHSETDTQKKRDDVYYTLNLIRRLKPDEKKVAQLINQYQIKTSLIFGKFDNLFPKSGAKHFIDLLNAVDVHEVELGHWLVTPSLDQYLINLTR